MRSRYSSSGTLSRREFMVRVGTVGTATSLLPRMPTLRAADQPEAVVTPLDRERVFKESTAIMANPERGFYAQRRSDRMDRLEQLREQGITLLLVTFDLRDFKDRGVSEEKLGELRDALDVARRNGFKVIFRAAYGFTNDDYRADPTDLTRIVRHIEQIGPVLTAASDVLWSIQAGMLGPWGEWHGSNHGNPPSLEARRAVLFAWLDAVPAPVTVHVRRPMFIRDIFQDEAGGSELTTEKAFSGTRLSRTGWHDDSFLVLPNDAGTYVEHGWDREAELMWCNQHGRFTPFGGETVFTDKPMPVEAMMREMELLHATYLNIGYHPRVLQRWRESDYRGENAFQHIARRLGYRFSAETLRCPGSVRQGNAFPFAITLKNVGWASPHMPRVVTVGLFPAKATEPAVSVILPDVDPRRWGPEAGAIRLVGELRVPADLPQGQSALGLRLGDASPRLREDGRFAIRLANDDVTFSGSSGWNILATDLT